MSKVNWLLALLLVAFVFCLLACGESQDNSAASSQSSTVQTQTQIQETTSTAAASVEQSNAEGSKGNSPGSNQQNTDGTEAVTQKNDVSTNGEGTSPQKDTSAEPDQKTNQNSNDQRSQSVASPQAPAVPAVQENDNAEVNFNDLKTVQN